MTLTTFALSIAVNILVTGLILFKIVKVSLAAKAFTTSGGTKLQHVIFVIIESGMALLAIQLVRITLYFLQTHYNSESTINAYIIMIGINEMFIDMYVSTSYVLRNEVRCDIIQMEQYRKKVNDVIRKSYGETARCVAIHTEKDTTLE